MQCSLAWSERLANHLKELRGNFKIFRKNCSEKRRIGQLISSYFPKNKPEGRHFDEIWFSRLTRAARQDMCLRKLNILKCPRFNFINEHRKTNRQKAQSLNEKFIQISLCIGLRSKRVQFSFAWCERLANHLKELRANFDANFRAEYGLKKKAARKTKNRSIRIVFQYKFTIKPAVFCELDS